MTLVVSAPGVLPTLAALCSTAVVSRALCYNASERKDVGATRHREFRTRKADLIGSTARYFQTVVKRIEQVRQRVGATPTGCSDASTDSSETKATSTSTIVIAPLSPSSSPSLSSSSSPEITRRGKEKREHCARSRNALLLLSRKMQLRRARVRSYAGNQRPRRGRQVGKRVKRHEPLINRRRMTFARINVYFYNALLS